MDCSKFKDGRDLRNSGVKGLSLHSKLYNSRFFQMGTSSSVADVAKADNRVVLEIIPDKKAMNHQKKQENPQKIKAGNETGSKKAEVSGNDTGQTGEPIGGIAASKETVNDADKVKEASSETKKPKEPPPPLTREEIEAMKKEILEIIETHINMMKDAEWLDENGKYNEGAKKLLYGFSLSYFALKNATLPDMIESRRQIASAILKTDILTKICGVVMDIYPKGWANEDNKTDLDVWNPLSKAFLILLNFSDASPELAERVSHTPGFLEMIRRILAESIERHLKQELPVSISIMFTLNVRAH